MRLFTHGTRKFNDNSKVCTNQLPSLPPLPLRTLGKMSTMAGKHAVINVY